MSRENFFEGRSGEVSSEEEQNQMKAKILDLLQKYNIKLDPDRKDQHFLISEGAIESLVESSDISKEDYVLEIGPGLGQITESIAEKAGAVQTIEIDERFKPVLDDLQKKYPNLEVIYGSALDVEWPRVNKLISSPPYSILEPLLERLAKAKSVQLTSLVIGKNFYQRATRPIGESSRTALITKAFFDVKGVSELKKEDFLPPAREDSVIMQLLRKDKKKADYGLRLLVSRMINTPNESVVSTIRDIISSNVNLKSRDYSNIPSVKSLGIPDTTMRKSLRDLDNVDVQVLARAIGSLKKKLRH